VRPASRALSTPRTTNVLAPLHCFLVADHKLLTFAFAVAVTVGGERAYCLLNQHHFQHALDIATTTKEEEVVVGITIRRNALQRCTLSSLLELHQLVLVLLVGQQWRQLDLL
jgi:hypothetical protein